MVRKIGQLLLARQTQRDVLPVALIVGSLLNGFNLLYHQLAWPQVVFHYLLPYCVASYGVVKTRYHQLRETSNDSGER